MTASDGYLSMKEFCCLSVRSRPRIQPLPGAAGTRWRTRAITTSEVKRPAESYALSFPSTRTESATARGELVRGTDEETSIACWMRGRPALWGESTRARSATDWIPVQGIIAASCTRESLDCCRQSVEEPEGIALLDQPPPNPKRGEFWTPRATSTIPSLDNFEPRTVFPSCLDAQKP